MITIGLTGGIASGKSTVSKILARLGAKIVDADLIARQIVEPLKPAWQEIVAYFGKGVLREDSTLDRKALGRIVFQDLTALNKLNSITHPKIIAEAKELLQRYLDEGTQVAVLDAALLIEAKMEVLVDSVWVVKVEPETQLRRLMVRDKVSQEQALDRMKAQTSLQEKLKFADQVISNDETEEELIATVEKLWRELLDEQKDSVNRP